VLAPLLNRPPEVAELAQRIVLEGLGGFGSPREVILAVGEQIEDLLEVERALAADDQEGSDSGFAFDADDIDDDDDAGRQQSVARDTDTDEGADESDSEEGSLTSQATNMPAPLDAQLPTLVRLLALRVPQMRGRKALPTVLHLSSLLRPAVSRFASHRPVVGLCREVALAVTRLVSAVYEWAQTGKDDWSPKGEQTVRCRHWTQQPRRPSPDECSSRSRYFSASSATRSSVSGLGSTSSHWSALRACRAFRRPHSSQSRARLFRGSATGRRASRKSLSVQLSMLPRSGGR